MTFAPRVSSRVPSCVLALALLLPATASAQRLVASLGIAEAYALLGDSGRHVVTYTNQRILAEDTDDVADVYVFSVATAAWRRLPRAVLVRVPEISSSSSFQLLSISDDGRYLGYVTRGTTPDGRLVPAILARFDLVTSTRVVVREAERDPFEQPVMSRDGSTFAWIGADNALLVGTVGQTPVAVATPCAPARDYCPAGPALTADGRRVLYFVRDEGRTVGLETFDRDTLARVAYPEFRPTAAPYVIATASGGHVYAPNTDGTGGVFDLATRRRDPVPVTFALRPAMSDDGRFVLMQDGRVYDRVSSLPLAFGGASRGLAADGRIVAFVSGSQYVLLDLDGDDDGILDPWETSYGLDPQDTLDAGGDADGDGSTSREEFARGSHPRGRYRRHLAEGVDGASFDSAVYVVSGEATTPVTVTFTDADGLSASRSVTGMQGFFYGYRAGEARRPDALAAGVFRVTVESDAAFAAERLTTWAGGDQRGAHAGTAVELSQTWVFAEGATIGPFQLFYLLANPGGTDAMATVTYLCRQFGAVTRNHAVPARSRATIWVNQERAPLDAAECGARIDASQPIVAERSLYLLGPDGFTGGTASAGRPAPATGWRFAAGDTRAPFDTFIALANPSGADARVSVRFRLPDGSEDVRTLDLPAFQRRTVWADQEGARLADTRFSIAVESDVPIAAERSMWWSEAGGPWVEGHTEGGTTAAAARWALAHVPESAAIHILNETTQVASVGVRLISTAEGRLATETRLEVPPGVSTVTPSAIWPALGPGLYSALFDSLPVADRPPVPIVVERTHRVPLRTAGTALVATPLP